MSDIGFGTSWLASRAGSDRAADRNRLDGLRDSDGRHSCDGVDLGVDGGGSHRRHGRHAAGRCGGVEHRARRLCRHRDRHGADDRAAAASHAPAPARGRHRAGHFLRSERRARRLQVLRRLHAGALAAARAAAEAQHQAAGGEGEQEEGYPDGGPEPEPEEGRDEEGGGERGGEGGEGEEAAREVADGGSDAWDQVGRDRNRPRKQDEAEPKQEEREEAEGPDLAGRLSVQRVEQLVERDGALAKLVERLLEPGDLCPDARPPRHHHAARADRSEHRRL
mmetsp:Transcript_40110/g.125840  ORF Transcript_40110/g.125840 Transcript_40110/m.125840 type:complete len:279 (-) Transcript_40110:883-1719(-)